LQRSWTLAERAFGQIGQLAAELGKVEHAFAEFSAFAEERAKPW
jgi:hypothetical protein